MRPCWIYITANRRGNVLYVGVTNDLVRRCREHRVTGRKSFAGRYNVHRLMYYERYAGARQAILREKQLKAGPRRAKERLINCANPEWLDLFDAETGGVRPLPAQTP